MAPFTPFLTDYLWGVLSGPAEPDSVHLACWPAADEALLDAQLPADMALVRRLVELGRSARASSATYGPASRSPAAWSARRASPRCPPQLVALVAEELNVREIDTLAGEGDDLVDHTVKPNFRALGGASASSRRRWRRRSTRRTRAGWRVNSA